MTAAGVGSLMICQRQLDHYRRATVEVAASPLLTPLVGDGRAPSGSRSAAGRPGRRGDPGGAAWLARNLNVGANPIMGSPLLWPLRHRADRSPGRSGRPGPARLVRRGPAVPPGHQQADGSWKASYGEVPNTAWAVLFLTRATTKTIAKIPGPAQRLGAGTLLGGRGLPKDLSRLTVAGGRVVVRPMNGAIEGMLAVLEDPRAEDADAALAGLVARYRAEGAAVLRPQRTASASSWPTPTPASGAWPPGRWPGPATWTSSRP
jgi:hypothetical protein